MPKQLLRRVLPDTDVVSGGATNCLKMPPSLPRLAEVRASAATCGQTFVKTALPGSGVSLVSAPDHEQLLANGGFLGLPSRSHADHPDGPLSLVPYGGRRNG